MTSAKRPCPICRKPASATHAPFCSARCRDRDLLQWLGEGYALPGLPAELAEDEDENRGSAQTYPHDDADR